MRRTGVGHFAIVEPPTFTAAVVGALLFRGWLTFSVAMASALPLQFTILHGPWFVEQLDG